jgi:hypothetical protein
MKNLNLYLIIAVVVLIFGLSIWGTYERKGRIKEKADRERLQYNQQQFMNDSLQYKKFNLSLEEFKKSLTHKLDSTLKAEKIKPKQVTSIIEKHYIYRDTSYTAIKPKPVTTETGDIFPFSNEKDCFRIDGYMQVFDKQPALIITNREFKNNSIDIAYIQREKKFWFIRYGKWRAQLLQKNSCPNSSSITKEIEVIKK